MNRSNITNQFTVSKQDEFLLEVQIACYTTIAVVSIIGNGLIWWKVLSRKRRRNSDYFIINLALSDILVGILSIPFDLTERLSNGWPFWGLMCKVVYPLQTVLMVVSVLTLLGISIERHRAVCAPIKSKPTRGFIKAVIFTLWIASVIFAIPYIWVLQYETAKNQCIENWPSGTYVQVYTLSIFVALYLFPLLFITICYVKVGLQLKQEIRNFNSIIKRCSRNNHMNRIITTRSTSNMRICKVFVAVVLVFALCQLPNHVMYLWYDFGNGGNWKYFTSFLPLSHILTYLNSAVDPFVLGVLECGCRRRKSRTQNKRSRNGLAFARKGIRSKSNRVLLKSSTTTTGSSMEMCTIDKSIENKY